MEKSITMTTFTDETLREERKTFTVPSHHVISITEDKDTGGYEVVIDFPRALVASAKREVIEAIENGLHKDH